MWEQGFLDFCMQFSVFITYNQKEIPLAMVTELFFFFKPVNQNKMTCFKYQSGIYLLKVSNSNTRKRCEICWKLTMKIPEDAWEQLWDFPGISYFPKILSHSATRDATSTKFIILEIK